MFLGATLALGKRWRWDTGTLDVVTGLVYAFFGISPLVGE